MAVTRVPNHGPVNPSEPPARCRCERPAPYRGEDDGLVHCFGCGHVVGGQPREVAEPEPVAVPVTPAERLDVQIRARCGEIRRQWIDLARMLHEMSEGPYRELGYRRFGDYLASIGLSYSQAHRLLRVWRRFVLEGGARPDELAEHNMSKLELVCRGDGPVDAGRLVEMASTHTTAQLQELYRNGKLGPARVPCPTCRRPMPLKAGRPPAAWGGAADGPLRQGGL
jgi:hypothetical protein